MESKVRKAEPVEVLTIKEISRGISRDPFPLIIHDLNTGE